jgi:hypothetical protein
MPEKGPFGEQIYPSYHHHLHNQMQSASNGFFRNASDQQSNAAHFSASTNFPSAFVAFHNTQMAAAAAASQRPATHDNNFNPSASFHYPHG